MRDEVIVKPKQLIQKGATDMAAISTIIAGVSAAAGLGAAAAANKNARATSAAAKKQAETAAANAKKQEKAQAAAMKQQQAQVDAQRKADQKIADDMLSAERATRLSAEKSAREAAQKTEALNIQAGVTAKEKSDLAAQAAGGNKATVVLGSSQLKDTALTEANKANVSSKKKKKATSSVGGLMSKSSNVGGL